MIIDTHAHLDFPDYKADLESVLSRAKEADIGCIINVGTSLASSKKSVTLANRFPPRLRQYWHPSPLMHQRSLIKTGRH